MDRQDLLDRLREIKRDCEAEQARLVRQLELFGEVDLDWYSYLQAIVVMALAQEGVMQAQMGGFDRRGGVG